MYSDIHTMHTILLYMFNSHSCAYVAMHLLYRNSGNFQLKYKFSSEKIPIFIAFIIFAEFRCCKKIDSFNFCQCNRRQFFFDGKNFWNYDRSFNNSTQLRDFIRKTNQVLCILSTNIITIPQSISSAVIHT